MYQRTFAAGSLALALTGVADAQEQADQGKATMLDRILVTDGRTPIEQENSGRAFTVISGEQLEKNQVRYVADALRQVPGFAVSRSGSFGGLTQVRVRGAEANHLLVMIDGVEVGETASGEFDFGSLLVDDIDRIEVLRGPQSAFWGSNATAGVVNIITKRGERGGFAVNARTEAGTDGTFLGGVSLRGGGENHDVALSAAFRRTDGFNISPDGDEKDGDRNTTLNGKFTVDLSPDLTVDATLRYVDRKSDTDPQDFEWGSETYGKVIDEPDWTATREFFGSVGATYVSMDGALTQKARFTGSDTHRDNFASAYGGSMSWDDGNRYNGTYQASYQFDTPNMLDAHHQLTAGYEWERETFAPSHLSETFSRNTNSFVGEYRGEFLDQFHINAGLRRDFNDRFEDATTWSLSGAWKIPDTATRLHASVGTGVTNPTFYEQFGFFPGSFKGNPDLIPEESTGFDLGIEQGFFDGGLVADITYFNQNLTHEIATDYSGPLPSPVNLDGVSKRQGVELSATLDLFNGFTATTTYTYTDASEQTVAGGPRLDEVRRPKHAGSLSAAYVFDEDHARVFGEVVFNGKTEDVAFVPSLPPRMTLESYTVVNIGGSYKLNDHLEAYGRIENLFDEQYQEVFGYNTEGRTAFIGLKGIY
ncbi:TonB-dependent receptor [Mesorhizobium sp.]|uniref:TonB-dependent receptor plug domain-containing protein n=1 Tax=Mesorhizobium sp. TaxID=1871066 RepID=UPI00121732DF|nr:TonB-dependent receptor [Mesorhizobium sp.]TIO05976.1 MAG: TonB-dependent receptor [Mesorhizobium sp.]TIO31340.1 MAG: TonB-dependent receptor [Mesorhizobium sp.]TIP12979.1 MAG: TonB-dependent receptor [Mesorhizobium sp.]